MSGQWGNTDNASNSVLWGVVNAKLHVNTYNQSALFENTTPSAFISNMEIGQFGVEASQMGVSSGPIYEASVTYAGSGYQNSPAQSVITGGGGSGGANLTFTNVTGRVTGYTIVNGGNYNTKPSIVVHAPELNVFNGNTGISGGGILFTSASSHWQVGDGVTYAGNATSTPVGLTNNTRYYIQAVNTTVITLSTTQGGPALTLTGAPYASTLAGGATIQGDTATAIVTGVGGALNNGVAHAGWVLRRAGTGGRAGRVQYETLVAMGTLQGTIDAAANTVLPSA